VKTTPSLPARFDPSDHAYYLGSERVPSITDILKAEKLIDLDWLTQEGRDRGSVVHRWTADYDLGTTPTVEGPYAPWLAAYAAARAIVRPEWLAIEEFYIHPVFRFGGTPDRIAVYDGTGPWEIKSGAEEAHHAIQTALQCLLVADTLRMRAEDMARHCLYLRKTGKWKLYAHPCRHDFSEARRLIRKWAM
jgi:hypothetical protein